MDFKVDHSDWERLSRPEKNHRLYLRQKSMLDTLLEHGAITRDQHDRSLQDLAERRQNDWRKS